MRNDSNRIATRSRSIRVVEATADLTHWTEMAFVAGVASSSNMEGQVGHVTPSAGLFGSPVRAKAPMLRIMASDSARRPARLARVYEMLAYSEGPKLPKANGKSNACAAP